VGVVGWVGRSAWWITAISPSSALFSASNVLVGALLLAITVLKNAQIGVHAPRVPH